MRKRTMSRIQNSEFRVGEGGILSFIFYLLSLFGAGLISLLIATYAFAGVYRIQEKRDWEQWTYPKGAVVLDDDGSVGLKWFRAPINAVEDAPEFQHESKDAKGLVSGGIRNAGSNRAAAERAIDGGVETWWQPSSEDDLEDWWIEVDLGRAVLATKVRFIFPDAAGARPFRNFSVYTAEGARTELRADIFQYTRVGGTMEPNTEQVVEYDLKTVDEGLATGEHLVTSDTLDFAVVQYVRFIAEEKQSGAALAEIEVDALGDNIALGTLERGGWIRAGTNEENSGSIADANINTDWRVTAEGKSAGDWEMSGGWFEWDLGATFWIDRLVSLEFPEYFGTSGSGNSRQYAFVFFTSDGKRLSGIAGDRIESNFDYEYLTRVENVKSPRQLKFDFHFPPREVRYIFYHYEPVFYQEGKAHNLFYKLFEYMLFGEGYPAEVEMSSQFLDLGGAKSIMRVEWDADTPAGTKVEIRSRTGDTFEVEVYYYNKSGKEIPEALWKKLPKTQKLPPVEVRRPGADWSGWSRVYTHSGEAFLSPSPRKYVQLKVALSSDDPQVAPGLRSISLHYDNPLIRGGVSGRILPREALLDSLQVFSYMIWPHFKVGDRGFDQMVIRVPSPAEDVVLSIGGQQVEPSEVAMIGDSLSVGFPRRVTVDSVEVQFRTRMVENATEFDAWVSDSRTGVRQGVKPLDLRATTVYIPSVAEERALIRQLEILPGAITPNGDGIHDFADIRFVVVKVEAGALKEPTVKVYTLRGEPVRSLERNDDGVYRWDGRDRSGDLVPPGVYICRVRMDADVGIQTAYRMIYVVY